MPGYFMLLNMKSSAVPVVLLAFILLNSSVKQVSAQQVQCFTASSTAIELGCEDTDPNVMAENIEECCLQSPSGQFYMQTSGARSCQACIVLGWFNGTELSVREQTEPITLEIGFIKGARFEQFTQLDRLRQLQFTISITPGTARMGVNLDFRVSNTRISIGPVATLAASIQVFIRSDGIALEMPENFTLTLTGRNDAANATLSATAPNIFVIPTVQVVIEDGDVAVLQFTESDYSNSESLRVISPSIQLSTNIATDLIVEAVPLNFTFVNDSQLALPVTFPNFTPRRPFIATNFPIEERDFDSTPVIVTFLAGNNAAIQAFDIEVVDDNINEVQQIFVVVLRVLQPADEDRVDLESGRFATLGIIVDDDTITIGFEQNSYTVREALNATRIPIIKGNNQRSEITFLLVSTISTGGGPNPANLTDDIIADTVQSKDFLPDEQSLPFEFQLVNDDIVEAVEVFQVELSLGSEETGISVNLGGRIADGSTLFASTEVFIIDDDVVRIGFEEIEYTVMESAGLATIIVGVLEGDIQRRVNVSLVTAVLSTDTVVATLDFLPLTTELVFDEINKRTMVNITIVNDGAIENPSETFSVSLVRDPMDPLDVVTISPDTATVTILDDDRIAIGLEQTVYSVGEGVGAVEVCACVLDGMLARQAVVTLLTEDRTAEGSMDYMAVSESLIFGPGTNRVCHNVSILDDDVAEAQFEFLNLTLTTTDIGVALEPDSGTVSIEDDDRIKTNDTVIGDPLFAVPINVPDLESLNIGSDKIYLCYEVHGQLDEWFNFITDECTSVNAHYSNSTGGFNIINQIAIRAVDSARDCREISVSLQNCSVELDGTPLTSNRFIRNEISIRRYISTRRVRVAVPNCEEQSLVMWITCQTDTIQNSILDDPVTFDLIRFDIMRGLNFGHRDSHGIIGQFWNVSIQLTRFNGILRGGVLEIPNSYIITFARASSPTRVFTGWLRPYTWGRLSGPCLYAGDRQGGPIYEVVDPNDPVIEGCYENYRVPSAFDETGYRFGRFEENICR